MPKPLYSIVIKPSALKEAAKLDINTRLKIISIIDNLPSNPYPTGCKKLRGAKCLFRIRIGVYRLMYDIDESQRQITVTRIRHRKDVYD